jgi:hypothetical protein
MFNLLLASSAPYPKNPQEACDTTDVLYYVHNNPEITVDIDGEMGVIMEEVISVDFWIGSKVQTFPSQGH